MRIFEPAPLSPCDKARIEKEIEKWKKNPIQIPIMPIRIQETVHSMRDRGEGQCSGDLASIMMFEPGHE